VGGISVIVAVVLIFFYLVYVVFPLFMPATAELSASGKRPDWERSSPVYSAVEEQQEVGTRITADGAIEFFHVSGGESILMSSVLPGVDGRLTHVAEAVEHNGQLAVATDGGQVFVIRLSFETRFDGGVDQRRIIPDFSFPFGDQPLLETAGEQITALALSSNGSGVALAALDANGHVDLLTATQRENLMTGEVTLDSSTLSADLGYPVTTMAVSGNQRWVYLGGEDGSLRVLRTSDLQLVQTVELDAGAVTAMSMLLGGISVLAGTEQGIVFQLFPVRDENNEYSLQRIREFHESSAAIRSILPEQRRKGFATLDINDRLAIYHSTAGTVVYSRSLEEVKPRSAALSPRADGLLLEGLQGQLALLNIQNEHPEVSFSSIWQKVWYENYSEPDYVWQSSAANNEFEPKLSLTPLVFGTLKAAIYAMLFAIPLALMGAAYTAYFMAPRLRQWVKPGIEIMAALPTVIIGFLAGLWFAPFVEHNLAGIFTLLLLLPPGVLLSAWLWQRFAGSLKSFVPEGYEALVQLPVLALIGYAAINIAEPLQYVIFGQELRSWLSNEAGISYDQRNALVVGCAMGFAVIPTIFSIAEDAIFGVPKSLSNGSLALGATPWQSLIRVVIPTASPGIFSGLMIGLGRAVGETMIVLMATGNTPIMDWNLFEGMRTLAANIAVEMPESEVASSHYRVLFLAALVLFLFTFVVNTGAELVRQRLRGRYSAL